MRPSALRGAEADDFDQRYPDQLMLKVYRVQPEKCAHFSGGHPRGRNRAFAHSGASACTPLRVPMHCFGEQMAVPVILNTSFNKSGSIMHTPEDATGCFMRIKMGTPTIYNYLVKT